MARGTHFKACHVCYLRGSPLGVHSNPSSVPSSTNIVFLPPNYSSSMSTNTDSSLQVRRSTRLNKALEEGLPTDSSEIVAFSTNESGTKEKRIEGCLSSREGESKDSRDSSRIDAFFESKSQGSGSKYRVDGTSLNIPPIASPSINSLKRKGDAQTEEAPPRKKLRGSDAIAAHMILHPGSRKFQPWTSGHKKYDLEKVYNKAIENLNILRDGQTTVTQEEKIKVAGLEADPRVLWYTFVSVKCAGCDGVLCGDKRRAFYTTLWSKHARSCEPAKAIYQRQDAPAPSMPTHTPKDHEGANSLVLLSSGFGTPSQASTPASLSS